MGWKIWAKKKAAAKFLNSILLRYILFIFFIHLLPVFFYFILKLKNSHLSHIVELCAVRLHIVPPMTSHKEQILSVNMQHLLRYCCLCSRQKWNSVLLTIKAKNLVKVNMFSFDKVLKIYFCTMLTNFPALNSLPLKYPFFFIDFMWLGRHASYIVLSYEIFCSSFPIVAYWSPELWADFESETRTGSLLLLYKASNCYLRVKTVWRFLHLLLNGER